MKKSYIIINIIVNLLSVDIENCKFSKMTFNFSPLFSNTNPIVIQHSFCDDNRFGNYLNICADGHEIAVFPFIVR